MLRSGTSSAAISYFLVEEGPTRTVLLQGSEETSQDSDFFLCV